MAMAIDRRRALGALGGAVGGALLPSRMSADAPMQARALFAAAAKDRQGKFSAIVFDPEAGTAVAQVELPARGHDIAVRAIAGGGRELVAFARRPENFAVAFSDDPARAPHWFTSRPDRHFFGHGIFSRDGRLLFTTENDFATSAGMIGVRDATKGYAQIGEFTSGGIDPHELALLGDGRTLVIANGGIRTHPDEPRLEGDLASMQPSLAYVDSQTGDLLERHELPAELHQLSIRHLCVGRDDKVLFGCQFRGPAWRAQATVGQHRRGRPLELLALPAPINLKIRNYVASLAVDRRGETAIIAAPRGGLAVVVDIASGRYVAEYALADVFGVAARPDGAGFMLAAGDGALAATVAKPADTIREFPHALAAAWDNHLVALR